MTRRDAIIQAITMSGPMSARDLAKRIKAPLPIVRATCSKAKAAGVLVKVGEEYALPAQFPRAARAVPSGDFDAQIAKLRAYWTQQAEIAALKLRQIEVLEGLTP